MISHLPYKVIRALETETNDCKPDTKACLWNWTPSSRPYTKPETNYCKPQLYVVSKKGKNKEKT